MWRVRLRGYSIKVTITYCTRGTLDGRHWRSKLDGLPFIQAASGIQKCQNPLPVTLIEVSRYFLVA